MRLLAGYSTRRAVGRIVLLVVCACPAAWGQFSNAYSSVPQHVGDQDEALKDARQRMLDDVSQLAMPDMLQAANHGDAAAMRNLGCVYWDGLIGHTPDAGHGLQWFERAAVAGNIEALSMIGDHYATGADGKPDFDLAKLWYGKGYASKDARSTIGLAEISCQGSGAKKDIVQCGQLLDQANGFLKESDALDVKPMLAESMSEVAGDYRWGSGIAANQAMAASWYQKAAALGRPSAAVALSKLYLEPGGLAVSTVNASAVLDGYLKTFGPNPVFSEPDRSSFANTYVEIGAVYERAGGDQLAQATVAYQKAADLGYPQALIALALRYAQGSGIPQDLGQAKTLLTGFSICEEHDPQARGIYDAALGKFNALASRQGVGPIMTQVCPAASWAADVTPIPQAPPVQPRYPNMLAPNTVGPQQTFPVFVSLNTTKLDNGTTIVSAPDQKNGELMVSMPPGMTSILIAVNLVAPQMTSVDKVSTQNIEMTVDKDSTTAVFQLQAGTDPGVEPIFATLTYNGAFLAELRRDVTVTAAGQAVSPQTSAATAPMVASAPTMAPVPSANPQAPAPSPAPSAAPPSPGVVAQSNVVRAPLMLNSAAAPQPSALSVAPAIQLNPEARAPDITIEEIQSNGSLLYMVSSPYLPGFEKSVVPVAATRQAIIAKLYSDLEAQGNNLEIRGGVSESQQAKDFAEGQGKDLYDNEAPQAFKTVYQKLEKLGIPPRTIEVLTDEPSLPWELMRPMTSDGKREDFLGLTLSVVHSTASSTPLKPPPAAERLDQIDVVIPTYTGDLALAGAQQELKSMQGNFPSLQTVKGTVTEVSSLARNLPDGIIHFAGHGLRVVKKGMPPDVGILLQDGSIIPATWLGLTERATGHPFYFFNACDLGQSDAVLNYVDGWAPKLLQSGASGYLGALWKVSDTTAGSFSGHFYSDLKSKLAGNAPWSMADLVTQARRETYMEHYDPTALSYVLYSAPYQTLSSGPATQ